jgi:phenylalanyl-tRNA synthetase beta chain
MKLPMSWLRDWVEVDADPEQVADALTRRGFYVEGIERLGQEHPGVVVARVLEVTKHPNADKLTLCRVEAGAGELTVVCGAPNVHAGMIAPLATVGAKLPGGTVIKRSRIRGVESEGMLCAADELGLAEDHSGIVDLAALLGASAGLAPGRPLDELLPPPDAILEVEVPFNRPDGLGVAGLAREVKAAFGHAWSAAARERLAARWPGGEGFDLEIEDREGCPRYIAQVVEGVRVAPSPAWLQRRLEAMGQRPINNVVDVTNLVLFELGQPLHAFDLDRLAGPAIRVRRARADERLTTLDGKDRGLDPEVLVIADRERPVALAGLMGGTDSEVSPGTGRLLLECAWFDPRRIRRGSRALGLSTEAAKRFERGVDPLGGAAATARFLALLAEVSPGARAGPGRELAHGPAAPAPLVLRGARCRRIIGVEVGADAAARHLEAFDFGVARRAPPGPAGSWELEIQVPGWRRDVEIEDDLVEEVARAHGYDRIPDAPLETRGVHAARTPRERGIERARRAMLARGFTEAWTTTLLSAREALEGLLLLEGASGAEDPAASAAGRLVRLVNPMSQEGEVLRPNLVPGLLRACALNLRQGAAAVRLFEVGAGFLSAGAPAAERRLPVETLMLVAVATGPRFAHAHDPVQQPLDFDDAKGLWEAWLEEMSVDSPVWRAYSAAGWKPGASAEVAAGTSRVGWAGSLGQPLLRTWDIEVPVHLFVVHLDPLLPGAAAARRAVLPGRFPPVSRDLAFFVPVACTHQQVEQALRRAARAPDPASGGSGLTSIELFDVYTGPGTPEGMKSLAYALRFGHVERTLQESEVQAIQDRMVAAVARECGGRLRER